MANIKQIQVGSTTYDVKDNMPRCVANIRGFQGYKSISDGTVTANAADMQLMCPWAPDAGSIRPIPGMGVTFSSSNSSYLTSGSYTGSQGGATGKKVYGIKIVQPGTYFINYNISGRSLSKGIQSVGVMKSNTSFYCNGGAEDTFCANIPYNNNASIHYTVGGNTFLTLAANDVLIFGTGASANASTFLTNIYLGGAPHTMTVIYLAR